MKLMESMFVRYSLTEHEQEQANLLTDLNIASLQTLLCSMAEEKINLSFDPEHKERFLQREAELGGQIKIIQEIIRISSDTKEEIAIRNRGGAE